MTLLIGQTIATILTALISIIALNKDLRAKSVKIKNDALTIKWVVIFVTLISIVNSCVSYFESQSNKAQLLHDRSVLNKELESIKVENAALRAQLTKTTIAQSNRVITSQEHSTKDLKNAANNLHNLINGSNKVPLFEFAELSPSVIVGMITNTSAKPVYNLTISISNFENIQGCKIISDPSGRGNSIDETCFTSNQIQLGVLNEIDGGSHRRINLPKFKENSLGGKYLIEIDFKSKLYYEEAIFRIESNSINEAIRVLECGNNDKALRSWIVPKKYAIRDVDWENEFPNKYLFHLRLIRF